MEVDPDKDILSLEKCLLCNEFSLAENTISLSDEIIKATYKDLIEMIMMQIISPNYKEFMLPSDAVCKYCFTRCNEVHEMEVKVKQGKLNLIEKYKNSTRPQSVPPLVPFAQPPKKVLNIPSSDEDEPHGNLQQARKMSTIQEIEEELVKIHGTDDSSAFPEIAKPSMELATVVEHDDNALEHLILGEINPSIKIETMEDDKSKVLHVNEDNAEQLKEEEDHEECDGIVHRNQDVYTCLMCEGPETVCGPSKAIAHHLKEEHNTRLYFCDICGDHFKKRPELSAHVQEHMANDDGDFQCETCHRIFVNLRLYRIHKRMHQPNVKPWACDFCGKKYGSRNLLEEHTNTHNGIRPYRCNDCGKDFASKYTFKAHRKTHESRSRPHNCSHCSKSFLTLANCMQHERTHQLAKNFCCHLCDKRFSTYHNLEIHSVVHTGYKPFGCNACGKCFARRAEVRDHERTHTGERPHQCEFCGATFAQRSNLQSHKRTTHYNEKRYECTECKKAFKRRRLLDYHMKAAHTGERPYKCNLCDSTFVYPEHFKKHHRIHTGEKPYHCEVCGKRFSSRDNRNAHRFVHSAKKLYECIECGAGFMRKPHLYQHMQIEGHMNETIVVNQPSLPENEESDVEVNDSGREVTALKIKKVTKDVVKPDDIEIEESKLMISDVIMDENDMKQLNESGTRLVLGGSSTGEHIIFNGQAFQFKGEDEDEEEEEEGQETFITTGDGFSNFITSEDFANGETQILQTKDGPVHVLAVRIPNDEGVEEEAWIKILPDVGE